jgi:hypothetical protein
MGEPAGTPATVGGQQGDGTQPADTDKPSGETPAAEAPGAAPPDAQEQPESFAVGSGKEAADATSRSWPLLWLGQRIRTAGDALAASHHGSGRELQWPLLNL